MRRRKQVTPEVANNPVALFQRPPGVSNRHHLLLPARELPREKIALADDVKPVEGVVIGHLPEIVIPFTDGEKRLGQGETNTFVNLSSEAVARFGRANRNRDDQPSGVHNCEHAWPRRA